MTRLEQLQARETHEKLRRVLMDNGAEEVGDVIIDEICQVFQEPDTCDIADEFGNLHPQSYYKN